MTDTTETRRQRGRKVAAILAGGLVLGVGTMATLAAWNDTEVATGTFTAGRFNMEGSADKGANWGDHTTSPGAALSFSTPFNNLQPGSTVYSTYQVRLAANTTNNATVALSASSDGSVAGLTYQLATVATATCDDAALAAGTNLVPAGTTIGSASASTFTLSKGTPTTSAGATVNLCFKVTAGAITQGQTGSGTWTFTATSTAS
nr:SipW-dependent-type signal peptide-containing protein [Propionicimonas sp.]